VHLVGFIIRIALAYIHPSTKWMLGTVLPEMKWPEHLLTNYVHLIAKLGMLEAVFIPSKIGGAMPIKGEITLPFTEVFELQNEVYYILQVWYR
jgi:hypothetical protein